CALPSFPTRRSSDLCLKRRRPHTFSPSNISWGLEDRSALIRIKGGTLESRHVEHRAPTGLANPYLIAAAILAAGLNGIEDELELDRKSTRLNSSHSQ